MDKPRLKTYFHYPAHRFRGVAFGCMLLYVTAVLAQGWHRLVHAHGAHHAGAALTVGALDNADESVHAAADHCPLCDHTFITDHTAGSSHHFLFLNAPTVQPATLLTQTTEAGVSSSASRAPPVVG